MPFFFLGAVRKGIDIGLIFCYEKFQIQQNRGEIEKNGLPLNFNETIPFDQDKVRTLHLVDKFVFLIYRSSFPHIICLMKFITVLSS